MFNFKNTLFVVLCSALSLGAQVVDVNNQQQFDQAIKDGLVVAKFSARWCPPCQQIKPYFLQLANDATYKAIKFLAIDTDQMRPLTGRLGVSTIPTFIFFAQGQRFIFVENGKSINMVNGADRVVLKKRLDALLASNKATKKD